MLTYISVIYINPLGQWEEMTYANAAALSQEGGVGLGRRLVCPLLDRGRREDTLNQSLCIPAYTSRTIPQRLIISRRTDSGQVHLGGGEGRENRVEGPQELGDRRIGFQHQQHISQQNVSPPSHFAFTTDRPHFTVFFCCFFNPLGHADKLESKSRPSAGESHL